MSQTILGPWLPDPYSDETAKKLDEAIKNRTYSQLNIEYGVLKIHFSIRGYESFSWLYTDTVWKTLMYFPEDPLIENGWLVMRANYQGQVDRHGKRVLPTLNEFPVDWKPFECVMKKIEPQWLISMCRTN